MNLNKNKNLVTSLIILIILLTLAAVYYFIFYPAQAYKAVPTKTTTRQGS